MSIIDLFKLAEDVALLDEVGSPGDECFDDEVLRINQELLKAAYYFKGWQERLADVSFLALCWPKSARFEFEDEPGEHDPCWLILPGGEKLALNHHATNGVDQARAKFIADACNSALDAADTSGKFR